LNVIIQLSNSLNKLYSAESFRRWLFDKSREPRLLWNTKVSVFKRDFNT